MTPAQMALVFVVIAAGLLVGVGLGLLRRVVRDAATLRDWDKDHRL